MLGPTVAVRVLNCVVSVLVVWVSRAALMLMVINSVFSLRQCPVSSLPVTRTFGVPFVLWTRMTVRLTVVRILGRRGPLVQFTLVSRLVGLTNMLLMFLMLRTRGKPPTVLCALTRISMYTRLPVPRRQLGT